MDQRLNQAAQEGDINALYLLIREDAFILEEIDKIPFVDTPLHGAAASGNVQFAMEIMTLKPSFAVKPNQDGFFPLHLALQNGHTRLALRLIEVNSELVRVRGREGITPLHYVAETENLDFLVKFFSVCPKSIQDVTIGNETALHLALKNSKVEALKALLGWLRRTSHHQYEDCDGILNGKNEEGNTVFHIAVSLNQLQAVKLLIGTRMDINAKNLEGLTAFDISQRQLDNNEIREALWRFGGLPGSLVTSHPEELSSKLSFLKRINVMFTRAELSSSIETRNIMIGVAVLVAATTYQAMTSLPSAGICQDKSSNQSPVNFNTTTFPTGNGTSSQVPFFWSACFSSTIALLHSG